MFCSAVIREKMEKTNLLFIHENNKTEASHIRFWQQQQAVCFGNNCGSRLSAVATYSSKLSVDGSKIIRILQ